MRIMDDQYLEITPTLVIPRAEFEFRTSRSGGPGGQNVNKVETRVELLFDLENSPTLTEAQRENLRIALKTWLDSDGVLHIVSDRYRSQFRNREDTVERFITLLQHALRPKKSRKPTRIPRAVSEQRLQEKKHRGELKRQRSHGRGYDD